MNQGAPPEVGQLKVRNIFLHVLWITVVACTYYLFIYVPKTSKPGEPVLALANYFLTYAPIQGRHEPAYVVPGSLEVWDTPADIRTQVARLESGDQVLALGHYHDWMHVRLLNGTEGWVNEYDLINAGTHEEEERLLDALAELPVQAIGHSADVDNVHIEPSRTAPAVAHVDPHERLEIFGRRIVTRSVEASDPDVPTVSSSPQEVWYLVHVGRHAGWILGRLVQLDIPKSISAYAQDTNLVAWLKLDTVADNGHPVPQYLVADRVGAETCDFTGIQVLTWWKKKQMYVIAYKEKGLEGYFPILVTHEGSVPHFRLRLVDDDGTKYQKVYALYDTITRVLGTADTWQSDAEPEPLASRPSKRRPRLSRSTRG